MKKIGKLSINPEKVMKNEELVMLKGGYFTIACPATGEIWGCGENIYQCLQECEECCPGDECRIFQY